jgi:nucleoside transporter
MKHGKFGVYWRLSAMMFLTYAIWGSWFSYLSVYLTDLGFSGLMISVIYNLLPFGILLSPVTGGQLADRYMSTDKLIVIASLLGAVLLAVMGLGLDLEGMEVKAAFLSLAGVMFVYAVIFGPTLALTNSLSFTHLGNVEKQFGAIRVWGTIGWIAAGWVLTGWWELMGVTRSSDCLVLSAVFSLILGVMAFFLPHTPPRREGVEPLAFVKAFRMLRQPNFLAFMLISFVVTTELYFYYILTGPFLENPSVAIEKKNIPMVMTTAQIGEILTMVILLPLLLPKLGVRICLALGVIAWPIRYAIFAIGHPWQAIVASLPIHGFCYVFFFVVGQIYVDKVVPKDIRASAQSLWAVFVLGIGAIVGGFFAGWIRDVFTTGTGAEAVTNWRAVFLVPMIVTIVCALAFLLFFRDPEREQAEAQQPD